MKEKLCNGMNYQNGRGTWVPPVRYHESGGGCL